MRKHPNLSFSRIKVAMERVPDSQTWRGLAHGSRFLRMSMDGVRIVHHDEGGLIYEVIPVPGEKAPSLRYYAEIAPTGSLPDHVSQPLPRAYLADAALRFLDGEPLTGIKGARRTVVGIEGGSFLSVSGVAGPRIRGEREPRPDDLTLARSIRDYYVGGRSPRLALAKQFGIEPGSADHWIRRARAAYPDIVPPPTTGRGNRKPTEKKDS